MGITSPNHRADNAGRTEVALSQSGGTFQVPVIINGALRLDFVIDSGASAVSIPADVVQTLLRTGTLRDSDFLGQQTYVTATGATFSSRTFRIRSLKVGDRLLEDVTGSIAPAAGDLLLGQSFLRRFQSGRSIMAAASWCLSDDETHRQPAVTRHLMALRRTSRSRSSSARPRRQVDVETDRRAARNH
jgi:hypothetical protein